MRKSRALFSAMSPGTVLLGCVVLQTNLRNSPRVTSAQKPNNHHMIPMGYGMVHQITISNRMDEDGSLS
jgi:hypothetical protein